MARFRCVYCGMMPKGFEFEDENGDGICPKCNRSTMPHVFPLVAVHFMVLDAKKGPILGSFGRQYVACQPKREHLALHAGEDFAATDDPRAVTCSACQRTQEFQDMAKLFPELQFQKPLPKASLITGPSCCGLEPS